MAALKFLLHFPLAAVLQRGEEEDVFSCRGGREVHFEAKCQQVYVFNRVKGKMRSMIA